MTESTENAAAIAKRPRFEPLKPMGSALTLKQMLKDQEGALSQVLPKHVTPERLIKTMLVAANRNPVLLKCTQASIVETISRAGELGLDLSGTLGEAYPVPFNNKVKVDDKDVWLMQATLIIGWRGLAKLARQSGEVSRLEAEAVYENDHFLYQKGSDFRVEFRPSLTGDSGPLLGYYAYARLKDGAEQAEYMTAGAVARIRNSSKSKDSPAWVNHPDEMGRKVVFKRLAKWLPLSAEKFQQAIELDNAEFDMDALLPETTAPAATGLVLDLEPESEPETEPTANGQAKPEAAEKLTTREQARAMKLFKAGGLTEDEIADKHDPPSAWTASTLAEAEALGGAS